MVDIQSAAAEIRQGKKRIRRKKLETTGQKYNGHRAAIKKTKNKNQTTLPIQSMSQSMKATPREAGSLWWVR